MRLHEETEDARATGPVPARATAEEFAAAVAALEARNSEAGKAGGLSSTVDIAEAVRELGLEADPQDVWAEVQDQRARHARAQAARRPVATRRRKRLVRVAAMFAGLTALVTGVLIDGRVIGAHLRHQGTAPAPAPWPSLSHIPDGVPVYAEGTDVAGLLQRKSPAQTLVSRSSGFYHRWTLIRHDGRIYLRGYVLPQVAPPGYLPRLSLYSEGAVGELTGVHSQAVTVPLDGAHWKDGRGADGWGEITLTDVQPDGHFHDKW